MKKTLILPLFAALALAGCSNPADGIDPAFLMAKASAESAGEAVQTPAPVAVAAPAPQREETQAAPQREETQPTQEEAATETPAEETQPAEEPSGGEAAEIPQTEETEPAQEEGQENQQETNEEAGETQTTEEAVQETTENDVWPKITPVEFDMDLEGYREAPKDSVYGINWVYVPKADAEFVESTSNKSIFLTCGGDILLKPIELHKSNPNGVQCVSKYEKVNSDFYKCIVYYKYDIELGRSFQQYTKYTYGGNSYTMPGLKLECPYSGRIDIRVSVTQNPETFKEHYGQL